MGSEPYWYVVKYQPDLDAALQELRRREFMAGRYNPVMPHIEFPITPQSPAPGARHPSIAAALRASDADGTRSILDIDHISDIPDFSAACPLSDVTIQELYGTTRPTREQVEDDMAFLDDIERGEAVFSVLWKDGQPDEVMFAGYSCD